MKYLFLIAVLLIGYGSLYPFKFRSQGLPFDALFDSSPMSRGDLLGNIALFLPFGYLGMVAWSRPRRPLRFVLVVLVAAIYGAFLQWVQLFLPARDPALRDVGPNVLGAAVGALVGSAPFLDVRRFAEKGGFRAAPWVFICLWLGYRLVPFVPTIDLQQWKDSLKPLRVWHPFPWSSTFHDAAAWTAVACLWAAAPVRRVTVWWLPILMGATFCLEVLIVDNWLSVATVVGGALGLVLAPVLARRPGCAAALLAGAILWSGLIRGPGDSAGGFDWIPFGGFLHGEMLINAQNFFEKSFLYGSLIWLGREAGLRLGLVALGTAVLLAGIEVAQAYLPGRSSEITDPLLALLAALFLRIADPPKPPPIPVESPFA